MKITKLSVHQNSKVLAIIMAILSFPLSFVYLGKELTDGVAPFWIVIVIVISNLVIVYLTTAVMCLIFNVLSKWIGGFEFDVKSDE